MGVPGLFNAIERISKDSIQELQKGESYNEHVDYLLLDANGLLHNAAQFVYGYGEFTRSIDMYAMLTKAERDAKVYEVFFKYLVGVTEIIRPNKVLYIAIDGPAPRAKQTQQRQRRYLAVGRTNTSFNSSSITPGTVFMSNLSVYLNYAIRKEMTSNTKWHGIQVIFDPPNCPGEGEHKCLEYIRNLPETIKQQNTFSFFGPDGDLIMLSLAVGIHNMKLLRQDQYRPGYYNYIDVGGKLSHDIFRTYTFRKKGDFSLQTVKNDFVISGLFVGNDFLPRIQMFTTVRCGLEFMKTIYMKMGHNTLSKMIGTTSHIHIDNLRVFVKYLACEEKKLLIEQLTSTDPRKLPPAGEIKYMNMLMLECVTENDGKIDLDINRYQRQYYLKKFKFPEKNMGHYINQVCHDYIKTLVWVYEYYTNGLVDWQWAYPYHYPPLMRDLSDYLDNHADVSFIFSLGEPTFPFEQLLSVLPPASASLIPKEYRAFILSPPEEMKIFFPEDFEIDYEGKIREHESIVLIPFMDPKLLREWYMRIKSSTRRFKRDELGGKYIFTRNEKPTCFESRYGYLKNMKVACKYIEV